MRRRVTSVLLLGFLAAEWALQGAPLPASSGTTPWQVFGKGTYRILATAGQEAVVGGEGKGALWRIGADGRRTPLRPAREGPVFAQGERLAQVSLSGRSVLLLSTPSGYQPVSPSPGGHRVAFRAPSTGGLYLGDARTLSAAPLTGRVPAPPAPVPGETATPVWVGARRLLLVSGAGQPAVWQLDLTGSSFRLLWNGGAFGQVWPLGLLRGDLLLGTGTGALMAISPAGHSMRFGAGMLPLGRAGMELAYARTRGLGPPSQVEVLDLSTGVSSAVPLPQGSHPVGAVSFSPAGDRLALLADRSGREVLVLATRLGGHWQANAYRLPTGAGRLARRTPVFLPGGRVLVAATRRGKTLSLVLTPPA